MGFSKSKIGSGGSYEYAKKYQENTVGCCVKFWNSAKIEVDGHTDSVGPEAYNMKLSERRAAAVKDYLIKEASVNSSKIAAIGFGEAKPVADNKTAAGRAQNRRVEILIMSD